MCYVHITFLKNDCFYIIFKIREWKMKRVFTYAMSLFDPDLIFILGDLLDEGQWASAVDFSNQVNRFNNLFNVIGYKAKLMNIVGNHDIGFHYA